MAVITLLCCMRSRRLSACGKLMEAFDSLIDILTNTLTSESNTIGAPRSVSLAHGGLIDAVALRVIQHLKELPVNVDTEQIQAITNGDIRCNGRVGADAPAGA